MSSQAACYYPDKSKATGFEACNSTLADPDGAGSACCATGDICTTGGFCLNDLYYPYRGACTDKSWDSGNCANECISVGISKNVPAVPCGDSGTFNGLFCCSVEQNTSCCSATFGNIFGSPFAPVTLAATNVNDTSSTNTSAVTTVTAIPAGHSNSDMTKIGVGVGVPLGLLLLMSLGFAAWTERRRRRDLKRVIREAGWSGVQRIHEKSRSDGINNMPYEVDGGGRPVLELGDRSP